MLYLAGIDYSMSSPGVCIHPLDSEWDPAKCRFLFFSGLKKHQDQEVLGDVFYIANTNKFTKEERIERYFELGTKTAQFLSRNNAVCAYIEGYSFNSRSNMSLQIGENGGIMRSALKANGISFSEVPPTTIKKFASGSGRSDKLEMINKFIEETGLDLYEIFGKKAASSPIDDLADAYYICKYAHEEQNL